MKRLAVFGASGHGKVVADTAECCGWQHVEFFDDAWPNQKTNGVWPVAGNGDSLLSQLNRFDGIVIAIGNNSLRQSKMIELLSIGAKVTTLVHPAATISRYAVIGLGSVIFAGAVVNTNATVGVGAIINTGCSVDHDCVLGDYVHISPGARLAGGVHIGNQSWVGIGSSIKQMVRIGNRVMVGAGATVIADVPDGVTVVGVPAKVLHF